MNLFIKSFLFSLPISLYALINGYKNHKVSSYLYIGISGLWLLIFAVFFGEGVFGEFTEQILTFIGSIIVAFAHYKNYQICRKIIVLVMIDAKDHFKKIS